MSKESIVTTEPEEYQTDAEILNDGLDTNLVKAGQEISKEADNSYSNALAYSKIAGVLTFVSFIGAALYISITQGI